MQISLRIPDDIPEKLDRFVDGIRYRSRAHLISVILHEWLEREERRESESVSTAD